MKWSEWIEVDQNGPIWANWTEVDKIGPNRTRVDRIDWIEMKFSNKIKGKLGDLLTYLYWPRNIYCLYVKKLNKITIKFDWISIFFLFIKKKNTHYAPLYLEIDLISSVLHFTPCALEWSEYVPFRHYSCMLHLWYDLGI